MIVKLVDGLWQLGIIALLLALYSFVPHNQQDEDQARPLCSRLSDSGKYEVDLFVRMMKHPVPELGRRKTESTRETRRRLTFLVMHLTVDRLDGASRWCRQWRGPMSLSFFVRPQDDEKNVTGLLFQDRCLDQYANIHLVRMTSAEKPLDMMVHYPFNVQRNAALDGALLPNEAKVIFGSAPTEGNRVATNVTHNVFLLDIDFYLIPEVAGASSEQNFSMFIAHSFNEARRVTSLPSGKRSGARSGRIALIIPAVETVVKSVRRPKNVTDLRHMLLANEVCAFYGHYCRPCHHPTRVEHFATPGAPPYFANYEEGYEPYVVMERTVEAASKAAGSSCSTSYVSSIPRYDESFVGRGWDKMSFFYQLHHIDRVDFVVVPGPYFLLHMGRGDMPSVLSVEYQNRQEENLYLWVAFKDRIAESQRALLIESTTLSHDLNKLLPHDELLWNATHERIPWKELDLTMGFQRICEPMPNATDDQLLAALEFVCGQESMLMWNCSALNRYAAFFPASLRVHAAWALDRYFHRAVARGEGASRACNFSGAARLASCTVPITGCSLSRHATDDIVDLILRDLCSGPRSFFANCSSMWPHIHPLVRDYKRLQAAVAVNARHLILRCAGNAVRAQFGAVGDGVTSTCLLHNATRIIAVERL